MPWSDRVLAVTVCLEIAASPWMRRAERLLAMTRSLTEPRGLLNVRDSMLSKAQIPGDTVLLLSLSILFFALNLSCEKDLGNKSNVQRDSANVGSSDRTDDGSVDEGQNLLNTAEINDAISNKPYSFGTGNKNFKPTPWIIDDRCRKYTEEFTFSPESANLFSSIKRCATYHFPSGTNYSVKYIPVDRWNYIITIFRNNVSRAKLKGQEYSVFVIDNDTLYFADYCCVRTGCRIISLDLSSGKLNWETELLGIIYMNHTCYSNSVNIDIENGILIIRGHEAGGDYVECLNPISGDIVAHHVFNHSFPGCLEQAMQMMDYGKSTKKIIEDYK